MKSLDRDSQESLILKYSIESRKIDIENSVEDKLSDYVNKFDLRSSLFRGNLPLYNYNMI